MSCCGKRERERGWRLTCMFGLCHSVWKLFRLTFHFFFFFLPPSFGVFIHQFRPPPWSQLEETHINLFFFLVWLKCLAGSEFLYDLLPVWLFDVIYTLLWWKTALLLTNSSVPLIMLHIIPSFERTMKIYERHLFSSFFFFPLSVTCRFEPCEPTEIHLFFSYRSAVYIWFNLKHCWHLCTLVEKSKKI